MSLDLPAVIATYFAADRGDGKSLAQCFTPDAIVTDEGRTHIGRSAIAAWKIGSSTKYTYSAEPFALENADGKTVATCHLVGDFPGSPLNLRYFFVLDGEKIAALEIAL